jgi:Uma2 family endonuclease
MLASSAQARVVDADRAEGDRRFVMHGVPWSIYVALRDATDEQSALKLTYSAGDLELLRPSMLHEDIKTIIARLLEAWAMERDVDLRGFGGMTLRSEVKRGGLEPDECYKLGKLESDSIPDIAIEVIVSNPLVDKLAVYARLGVPEVWTWQPESARVEVQRLVGDHYEARPASEILPDLDLKILSQFVRPGERQTQLAKAYQISLRRG